MGMDPAIQGQGRELQEVLKQFKLATSTPSSATVLPTPRLKNSSAGDKSAMVEEVGDKQRKSPRFSKKNVSGKSMIRLAQELVARKCGILG
jgi:hypothetical protein